MKNIVLVLVFIILLSITACSLHGSSALEGKKFVFIDGDKEGGIIVYDLISNSRELFYIDGYNEKNISNICYYENEQYYCSYESDKSIKILKVNHGIVVRSQEITINLSSKYSENIIKKIAVYKNGILLMLDSCCFYKESTISRSFNNTAKNSFNIYFFVFDEPPKLILEGVNGFSVHNDTIYYYKTDWDLSVKTDSCFVDIYSFVNGKISALFQPGECPYKSICGWKNDDTFYSFRDGKLVEYSISQKKESVLLHNIGFSFYGDNVFPLSERYILTFASLPWFQQNPDITYYYLYLFDLKNRKRMLIDEYICNECQDSYNLV